ncbi:MAG TPA: DinB family protein [Gemmatimonadales bacterium]|jgi:uncharacterized damage-inducible protein DinB
MHRRLAALLALTLAPAAAQAQGTATIQPLYEMAKGWLVKSAEMLPEADYGFKPTPAVRSFGQLIGHVANANYMICATAKGEKNPAAQDFEKTTEKAALVKALKDALAYCDPVYKMADADLTATAEMFGMKMTRLGWAFLNVTHDNEHYGNLVTYLRMKGLTPPSSQGPGM